MANANKKSVSVEQFVLSFMSLDTMDKVMEATGLTKGSIQSKASHLRKKGVKLPRKFNEGRTTKSIDIDALNKLIENNGKPETPAAKTEQPASTTSKKGRK